MCTEDQRLVIFFAYFHQKLLTISKRDVLYEKYYTDKESQTEYIILDLRLGTTEYNVNDYLNSDKYETVFYTPYRVAVFKNINVNV